MLKNVLVAIDGSEHADAATEQALWLGKKFGARLVGHHVVDIVSIEGSFLHDISGSLGFEPYLDFSSRMREALEERGRALLSAFEERCTKADVACETTMGLGIIANEICQQAKTADVVVLGHRGVNEKFTTGLLGGTAESVTRKCPQPVMVCPATWCEPRRAVLAYDGSERSAKAMHWAAEIATTTAIPLHVLHVGKTGESGTTPMDEAERYLAPYDLEPTYESLVGSAPEAIVEALADDGSDLLFVGAYGQSRILELVLGSTTEYVLRNAPGAVLLHR